ncbi:hypothetical protein TWF718_000777 [Orbilia javanica]|uniref:Uncharacterized protein n=1 Tax=Orbilia javanica TaxID=47235 RepID=A0AAN8N7U8_9PEZI
MFGRLAVGGGAVLGTFQIFSWLGQKFDKINERIDEVNKKIDERMTRKGAFYQTIEVGKRSPGNTEVLAMAGPAPALVPGTGIFAEL